MRRCQRSAHEGVRSHEAALTGQPVERSKYEKQQAKRQRTRRHYRRDSKCSARSCPPRLPAVEHPSVRQPPAGDRKPNEDGRHGSKSILVGDDSERGNRCDHGNGHPERAQRRSIGLLCHLHYRPTPVGATSCTPDSSCSFICRMRWLRFLTNSIRTSGCSCTSACRRSLRSTRTVVEPVDCAPADRGSASKTDISPRTELGPSRASVTSRPSWSRWTRISPSRTTYSSVPTSPLMKIVSPLA